MQKREGQRSTFQILFLLTSFAAQSSLAQSTSFTQDPTHLQTTFGTPDQQKSRPQAPVLKPECLSTRPTGNPKILDYTGKQVSLADEGAQKPSLVIVAPPSSQEAVLEFLQKFSAPVWEHRRSRRVYNALVNNSGRFFSDLRNESLTEANSNFAQEMGKLNDLRVVFLVDARPLYQGELAKAQELAQKERARAISVGADEGARRGAELGAKVGNQYSLPVFRSVFGLAERIGRERGAEEGRRQGAQVGSQVADTVIPPYVTFRAEKELLAQADEHLTPMKKMLQDYLLTNVEKQSWVSILVDKDDFANGLTPKSRAQVQWANSYLDRDQQLDVESAIDVHENFLKKVNDADETLELLLKRKDTGFHVALVSPKGNIFKQWSNDKIDPLIVAEQYLKYQEYLDGTRVTKNGKRYKEEPKDPDCDGIPNHFP